jgi:hypothetical protein
MEKRNADLVTTTFEEANKQTKGKRGLRQKEGKNAKTNQE